MDIKNWLSIPIDNPQYFNLLRLELSTNLIFRVKKIQKTIKA